MSSAPPDHDPAPTLTMPCLAVPGVVHGFFTRAGGVSEGPFARLNCSVTSGDDPARLAENRRRVAVAMGVAPDRLLGLSQVHGVDVVVAEAAWAPGAGGRADAMVTRMPGLALGIITADCAPVLFADAEAGVVGAAHAGWRGAVAGVLEATLAAMVGLGAVVSRVRAAVGPCIGQASYEVGDEMRAAVLAASPVAARRFVPGRPGHHQFDLAGYCLDRLREAGTGRAEAIGGDTLAEPEIFFSHRRRVLAGGGPIGHQISVIALHPVAG